MFRVGMLGWGAIGNVHGRVYKAMPDVKVVALADVEPDRRQKGAEFMEAEPYSSAEELIHNADVDMIDICLPTFLHSQYAVMAMEKGFHVLSEKPMALNYEQCTDMIEAQKKTGKSLMIGHCIRFWREYSYLKKVYSEKTFGNLQVLSLTRVGGLSTKSWRNWMLDPQLSGSQTVDRHIHDTDFVLYLLGKPNAVRTVGYVDQYGLSHVSTHYIYDNGPAVFAEGGGNIPVDYKFFMGFRAVFDDATVEFNRYNTPALCVYPWNGKPYEPDWKEPFSAEASSESTGLNITSLGAYYNEIRYFIDCIKAGKAPEVITPEEARDTLTIVLAEVESAYTKKTVDL
ncbi:MAG TPA: Gfo/Idh/MocA family oxidoreductase [Firmicutes bacterium]|nr:Gfo/Idh/MocA family oxidoreductase [Bacillota bacterium]